MKNASVKAEECLKVMYDKVSGLYRFSSISIGISTLDDRVEQSLEQTVGALHSAFSFIRAPEASVVPKSRECADYPCNRPFCPP